MAPSGASGAAGSSIKSGCSEAIAGSGSGAGWIANITLLD